MNSLTLVTLLSLVAVFAFWVRLERAEFKQPKLLKVDTRTRFRLDR